ncbi:bifunctional metallophosphatase/5'-nucleotidase [Halosolutus halophilus]|uniref:bifunctional metallophosphatase/5'-nucleotidase n=1 Tax=Halosolutus halophilus TaxID=1552990 RepID=UPI0022352C7E|nr:5'-nucleotidase C-terminal domain-containing protein [Halosolutus halophilus]
MGKHTDRPDSDAYEIGRRNVLSGAIGGIAVGLGVAGTTTASAQSDPTVTVLHDTHFHGRFGDPTDDGTMDIARYQTLVDKRRTARENAVFLGIGDDIAPSIMGLAYEGAHMIEALNYMDPLAVGAGNHEFDFGIDVAVDRFAESEFPWVVANLLTPEDEPVPETERWITRDVGDITLGIFGSGVGAFHDITDYPDDYRALDPVEASREATAALRDAGADVVVLASHANHSTHYDIAEAVDDLDAIVGSHSEVVFDEPETHAGTLISEFGDEFDHLGELTLDADGNLVDWDRHDPDPADLDPDEGMAAIVADWRTALEEEYGREYFASDVALDARFDTNYARESELGNLICDLMMEYAEEHADGVEQVDVALQNAGGIRSNRVYGPGPITGLAWLDVLPFPNTIVTMEVDGSTVEEILESQIAALPWSAFGAQQSVQVGGVQYEWTGHFGDGSVENVYVQGAPLDREATYTFTTNDYVAGFDEFDDAEVIHESDDFLGFITLEMLEEKGAVSPSVDHRIQRVDEDVDSLTDLVRRRGRTSVRFDAPESQTAIEGESFYAVNQNGERLDATRTDLEDDDLWVSFPTERLQQLAAGRGDQDVRVFGGFDPDESWYGYEDDGELLELPVAAAWDHFVMKGDVDDEAIRGRGP